MSTLGQLMTPRRFLTCPVPVRGGQASFTLPTDVTPAEVRRFLRVLHAWTLIDDKDETSAGER